jgi:hypothetical protein
MIRLGGGGRFRGAQENDLDSDEHGNGEGDDKKDLFHGLISGLTATIRDRQSMRRTGTR